MILYIHGFAGCGDSTKSRLLKAHFGAENVLSPDVPVEPERAMEFLGSLIVRHGIDLLIGSSLGGFYATALCALHGLDAVLLNPSVHPQRTLESFVGEHKFWCSEERFEWTRDYLAQLDAIAQRLSSPAGRMLVLLQSGDEVLDYRVAQHAYREHDVVVETGGNHRFENLQTYLPRIEAFYRTLQSTR